MITGIDLNLGVILWDNFTVSFGGFSACGKNLVCGFTKHGEGGLAGTAGRGPQGLNSLEL